MTFQQQLIITIVDKAVIGLFIALAGYFLSRALERFKSERALTNEFDKQRMTKIAELWEAIYDLEAEVLFQSEVVQKSIFSISDDKIPPALERSVPKITDLIDSRAKEISRRIDRSRFWLGASLHAHFRSYYDALLGHLALLLERPRNASPLELQEDLNAARKSIIDYFSLAFRH